jgi:hypothetical protein
MTYDSRQDTLDHIESVRDKINAVTRRLAVRALAHDSSKLKTPEKEAFDEVTPLLRGTTYGSEEYKANLRRIKPAIDHHQKNNSHHPEFFHWHCPICQWQGGPSDYETAPQGPNDSGVRYCPRCCANGMIYESELMDKPDLGINGMSLLDLVEMFCDWKAATERHADGDIKRSIEINQKRFNMTPQLASILENTRKELGW